MKKVLVCNACGTKGFAHLGAIKYLQEKKLIDIDTYIGTSAGALVVSFILLGYTPDELLEFIINLGLENLSNCSIDSLFNNMGFDNGEIFIYVIKKLIERKTNNPDITFKQLFELTNKKLIICVSCINDKQSYYFDYITQPDLEVYKALRMSISIPYYYTPYKYNNKLFVDGALFNNYPIDIVKDRINETIGIYIESDNNKHNNIETLEDFTFALYKCFRSTACKNKYIYSDNTIKIIPYNNFHTIKFNMNNDDIINLFNIGYNQTKEQLDKSLDKPIDKPINESLDKPIDKSLDKLSVELIDKSTDELIEKSSNESLDKSTNDLIDVSSDESLDN